MIYALTGLIIRLFVANRVMEMTLKGGNYYNLVKKAGSLAKLWGFRLALSE